MNLHPVRGFVRGSHARAQAERPLFPCGFRAIAGERRGFGGVCEEVCDFLPEPVVNLPPENRVNRGGDPENFPIGAETHHGV